jgi:hypothetical protein
LTEIAEHLLPPHEPNEKFFRLLAAALAYLRSRRRGLWGGRYVFQPCGPCGSRAFFPSCASAANPETIAEEMLQTPLSRFDAAGVDQSDGERSAPRADPHHGAARRAQISDRSACWRPCNPFLMDSFQETVFKLKRYWADRGAIIQEPYDIEVGAGTMCPETFLRVLGPKPYRVAYVQPSRRPADGRYGENPNRLYKHQQLQVILKPSPDDVIDQYLGSLEAIGIDLKSTTSSSRKTTGKRRRWARGASDGR